MDRAIRALKADGASFQRDPNRAVSDHGDAPASEISHERLEDQPRVHVVISARDSDDPHMSAELGFERLERPWVCVVDLVDHRTLELHRTIDLGLVSTVETNQEGPALSKADRAICGAFNLISKRWPNPG